MTMVIVLIARNEKIISTLSNVDENKEASNKTYTV